MNNDWNFLPERGDLPEKKSTFSNTRDFSIGLRMNDKGRSNRDHQNQNKASTKLVNDLGLIMREEM